MTELAFPLLGMVAVFFVALPLTTLLAKGILVWLRKNTGDLPSWGKSAPWLLTIGAVVAPIVWFISAALHQSEPGVAVAACLKGHLSSDACHDALALALGLISVVALSVMLRTRSERIRCKPSIIAAGSPQQARLMRLVVAHQDLRSLRVVLNCVDSAPICTLGLFRPRIEVNPTLIDALDDPALTAALLHEAAHVRAFDPLRFFLLGLCASINPAAAVLRGEAKRWRFGREAACDEEAVAFGADPLALAQAIVCAARGDSSTVPSHAAALGAQEVEPISLRVGLLLRQAGGTAGPRRSAFPLWGLMVLILLSAALPHLLGSGPLDALHLGIETTLAGF